MYSPLLPRIRFWVLKIVSTSPEEMKGRVNSECDPSNLSWEGRRPQKQARPAQPLKGMDLDWAGEELAMGSHLPASRVLPALSFLSPSKEDQHRVHSIFISVVLFHSVS